MHLSATAKERLQPSELADARPPSQSVRTPIDPKLLAMTSENDGGASSSAKPRITDMHSQPSSLPPTAVEAAPIGISTDNPNSVDNDKAPAPGSAERRQVQRGPCHRCTSKGMGASCFFTPSRTACDECHRLKKGCKGKPVAAAHAVGFASVNSGRVRKRAAQGSASDPDRPAPALRKVPSPPSRQALLGGPSASGGVAPDSRGADKANKPDDDRARADSNAPAALVPATTPRVPARTALPVRHAAVTNAAPDCDLAAAQPNALQEAESVRGAPGQECLWLCTLCPRGTPASKLPETRLHVLNHHHPLLMAALKEQAWSGLRNVAGNKEALLQCRVCNETFVAVLDQTDIALNHVADVHLSNVKQGLFAHADTCMRPAA